MYNSAKIIELIYHKHRDGFVLWSNMKRHNKRMAGSTCMCVYVCVPTSKLSIGVSWWLPVECN